MNKVWLWLADRVPGIEGLARVKQLRSELLRAERQKHFVLYGRVPEGCTLNDILPFPRREANFFNMGRFGGSEKALEQLLRTKGESDEVIDLMVDEALVESRGLLAFLRYWVVGRFCFSPVAGRKCRLTKSGQQCSE
jgi:hypothetical protein